MLTQKKSYNFFTLVLLLALLISAGNILGGTLKGQVTDRTTGEGLLHAIITVDSDQPGFKTQGTVADDNGNYKIENLPAGLYTVKFSYVGFTSFTEFDFAIQETGEVELSGALVPVAINMQSISVTASRQPEKIVDAPAAVSMVSSAEVSERATLTPTEHIKSLPAIDIATTGLAQSNVVVRGFNNIFSGAMLVLTDNRIARVPSLRFNAHNFITTVNDDIERIEVVAGPGSALYGPNASSGVMHIITKSPFTSQGTSVTFGGGERELFLGSFRHAGVFSDRVGYKITGQYYQGLDWKHHEPIEPDSVYLYRPTPDGPDTVSGLVANNRNFDIEKISGEGRMDFIFNNDAHLIVNGGFNRGSSIELTGLGAGQAIDWSYYYGQARLTYKDLFIQGFVNASDAGDTYLLNTGQLIVDKSRLWVAQVQHRYQFSPQLEFTYGLDGLFTRPNTEYTINGRNEDDDNINEIGGYLQGEYKFNNQLKLVGAARLDDHNKLEDPIFSPRAGIVYQPDENNNFRFTFNEAFSTPDNNTLYLDILSARTAFFDLRVQGVPETGFHWSINDNGPQFRSQFAPYDPRDIDVNDYINYNDPIFTNVMWGVGYDVVTEQFLNTLQTNYGLTQPQLDAIEASLGALVPSQLMATENALKTFNPDNLGFDPSTVSDIADINRMEPTITRTLELGYKGIINDRFQLSVSLYRTEKENFIGPLTVETPNVFLDQQTLMTELFTGIETNSNDAGNAMADATIASLDLDNPNNGGNGNGTYSDELAYIYASGAEQIPFGVVSPEEALDPNTVLITYRNFGDVSFYGADFGFNVHLNQNFNVGGSYSYVSKNFFPKSKDQVHDIYLNAPKHKFGLNLNFTHPTRRMDVRTRARFVDAFKMVSPFEGSEVKSYFVLDFNFGIDIIQNTRLNLTVQNILDNRHAEFVGAPELGRLAIMKVTTEF